MSDVRHACHALRQQTRAILVAVVGDSVMENGWGDRPVGGGPALSARDRDLPHQERKAGTPSVRRIAQTKVANRTPSSARRRVCCLSSTMKGLVLSMISRRPGGLRGP